MAASKPPSSLLQSWALVEVPVEDNAPFRDTHQVDKSSQSDPLSDEQKITEQLDIEAQQIKDKDCFALNCIWDGLTETANLKVCFTASRIGRKLNVDEKDVKTLFTGILKCNSVEELHESVTELTTIFDGKLEFKLTKINNNYQVTIFFTTPYDRQAYCTFEHLKSCDQTLPESLKDCVVENIPSVFKTAFDITQKHKFVVDGFLCCPQKCTDTVLEVQKYRKLVQFEPHLLAVLKISKLIADESEYHQLFPNSPFDSIPEQDSKQNLEDRRHIRRENRVLATSITHSIIGKLQLFRAVQKYQPNILNIFFQRISTEGFPYFSDVVDIFDSDISVGYTGKCPVTSYHGGSWRMELIPVTSDSVATSVANTISKTQNLIPSSELPIRLTICHEVNPAGKGLHNWGTTCFVNAVFQMMSTSLSNSKTESELHDFTKIPPAAMSIMVDKVLETTSITSDTFIIEVGSIKLQVSIAGKVRNERADAIASVLSIFTVAEMSQPLVLIQQSAEPQTINLELIKWTRFRKTCCDIFDEINQKEQLSKIPIQFQIEFLNSYYDLAKYLFRTSSLTLLFPRNEFTELLLNMPEQLMFARIAQHDPQEFVQDVFDLLGVYNQSDRFLATTEFYCLHDVSANADLSKHSAATTSASQFISIDNKTDSPNIDVILEKFSSKEELTYGETVLLEPFKRLTAQNMDIPYDEFVKRLPQEYLEAADTDTEEVDKSEPSESKVIEAKNALKQTFKQHKIYKQLNFVAESENIPSRIMLQLKLFRRNSDGTTVKPTTTFNSDDSVVTGDLGHHSLLELIKNGRLVNVPIYLDNDETPTIVTYQVDCVTCHSGASVVFGHYTTLKFEVNGEIVFFDDNIAVQFRDYQKVMGQNPDCSIAQFIDKHKLSGYLYSLRLATVTDQNIVPRETLNLA